MTTKDVPKSNKSQVSLLKKDCALFSRLYIACQSRDGDLIDFFKHENQPWPPAIANMGDIRTGTKADLLQCLEMHCNNSLKKLSVDIEIYDGAFVVQRIKPTDCKTVKDYAFSKFKPYKSCDTKGCKRIDLILDVYLPQSLKAKTLQKKRQRFKKKGFAIESVSYQLIKLSAR